MDSKQLDMLKEIMEICFCLTDINLYLDTHPNDDRAVALHNTFSKKYKELTNMYSMKYGPLTNYDLSKYPWEYTKSPWPWEIEY
ncbi:spore coat protein JB [Caloranaerobacter azorensis DSM 13643]|uniref:Spore coat protein JB n=1 Tax=Caloranaerobacter azorensis DSM 13643 TaxID=1121264 RepID=A0A1M5TDX8_9FIRM|nr:spore coat protein CotJB [Caloranaerobacter azorensis]SHH48908.1 spore coat protein JB [Caloranaerobacter azorensis DSM 13643]